MVFTCANFGLLNYDSLQDTFPHVNCCTVVDTFCGQTVFNFIHNTTSFHLNIASFESVSNLILPFAM